MNSWIKNLNTLFQRYLRYLTNIPESSPNHPLDAEDIRRINILFFISIIGILGLLPFGIIVLIAKSYTLGMLDITVASVLAVNLLHARSYRNYNFNIYVGITFMAILFLYIFLTGGIENTGFIWYCTFPMIAFLALDLRKGPSSLF